MKAHNESRLTDLLIEFDEMGFCPTTVCPHPEQYAIEWKEQIVKEIQKLQAENAELRSRLERAVELPCEVGDTIYWICKACDAPCECKYYTCEYPEGAECHAPSLPYGYSGGVCFSDEIVDEECKKHFYVEEWKFNLRFLNPKTGKLEPQYFIDREAAEARLKEMQG